MKGKEKRKSNLELERKFQRGLKSEIKELLPGCMIFKLYPDPQGIPDLLVLYEDKWATLECKRSCKAKRQPNQEYYVEKMNNMSFSRFVYPENKEEVLDDLQKTFRG